MIERLQEFADAAPWGILISVVILAIIIAQFEEMLDEHGVFGNSKYPE